MWLSREAVGPLPVITAKVNDFFIVSVIDFVEAARAAMPPVPLPAVQSAPVGKVPIRSGRQAAASSSRHSGRHPHPHHTNQRQQVGADLVTAPVGIYGPSEECTRTGRRAPSIRQEVLDLRPRYRCAHAKKLDCPPSLCALQAHERLVLPLCCEAPAQTPTLTRGRGPVSVATPSDGHQNCLTEKKTEPSRHACLWLNRGLPVSRVA